jgi:hypothetical protein
VIHPIEHNAACPKRKCAGRRATIARFGNLSPSAGAVTILGTKREAGRSRDPAGAPDQRPRHVGLERSAARQRINDRSQSSLACLRRDCLDTRAC